MRKIGCLVRWVLFTLNILVAIGFLISAYSPYICNHSIFRLDTHVP